MTAKIFEIDKNNIDKNLLKEAAALLHNGGLVAFPTETVYGLGGNAFKKDDVAKIFIAKGRPGDNPLIVHIHSFDQLSLLAEEVPESAKLLAEKFWPGPLTMIFKAKKDIPLNVTGGLDTVGVRMPSDPVALEFLKAANVPVAAPSANISGKPSPTQGRHVIDDLGERIDGIIVSSDSRIGIESTVLDITVNPALILRPGSVSLEEIRKYIDVEYEAFVSTKKLISPGTKYKHYAPESELYIIKGSFQEKLQKFIDIILVAGNEKIGFLITEELFAQLNLQNTENFVVKISGTTKKPDEFTAGLYKYLREFDSEKTDIIYMEGIPEEISGKAFQNRIEKASGGKVL